MPTHLSSFWGLARHEFDPRNEVAYRYLTDEGLRGRHDPRIDGPPFVSEPFLRHRALRQEAAHTQLTREARRAQQSAQPDRARRRLPRIVDLLRRARRLVGRLRAA